MNPRRTVADAHGYWLRYYNERFVFGQGTEQILAALQQIPRVARWVDLGSGSESMLWSIALRADQLTAVDSDPDRLAILDRFAAVGQPRAIHTTTLRLCQREDPQAFSTRCDSLTACLVVDCLTGRMPEHPQLAEQSFDLVTQFGLLGMCSDTDEFRDCFTAIHQLAAPGGWVAGANWVAMNPCGRVELTEQLYRDAADAGGVELSQLHRVDSTDPDFPAVWMYLGTRRISCPPPQTPN
ncbi:methyltransferase domain-containing protein [Nocardia sp. NPDC052278]|uniref:methyltransferase domain-containing protein n=1 Tax=unclassified Nocardia TaxID=2637762 RepID=UPI0036738246